MEIGDIEPILIVHKEDMEAITYRVDLLEERHVRQEGIIRRLTEKLEEIDRILLEAVRKR